MLARILATAEVADDFAYLARTPAKASRSALEKAGLKPDDIDLWEINEAFASVAINSVRMLGIDEDKVNVNGGAIALGHPIGASGARILTTLIYELRRRGGGRGCRGDLLGRRPGRRGDRRGQRLVEPSWPRGALSVRGPRRLHRSGADRQPARRRARRRRSRRRAHGGVRARDAALRDDASCRPASDDGADYRNRIFTVAGEIPFAGHPSLGTAVAVADARGEREASYVQQTGAGLQPVDVRMENDHAWASMLQEPAEFGPEVDPHDVVAAVGLVIGEAHRELTPQVVSTGLPTLIAPVLKVTCVSAAKPDFELVDALAEKYGAPNLYLVCLQDEGKARARMFTRAVEGGEDSATGSAAGPLCAYLADRGRGHRVEITQGVEMRRPSRLLAEMHRRPPARRRLRGEDHRRRSPALTRGRLLRPRPHVDGGLERLPLRPRDVQGGADDRAARSRAMRSTRSGSGSRARPTRP